MEDRSKIKPYNEGFLEVSDLHKIHFEEWGNPNGPAILYVHGGPGAGISPSSRKFFDPKKWRVVLFSQRGAGKSLPPAELNENSTWHLVSDMETLRKSLGIEKWVLFGGSWGSTLSLCYGIKHPEACLGLILRGIFLSRQKELSWLYSCGASRIFPDFYEDFRNHIPPEEQNDILAGYYKRLTSSDKQTQLSAAIEWSKWEGRISRLIPDDAAVDDFAEPDFAIALARIECHYFVNKSFLPSDNYILDNIDKLAHLPVSIVQGRYDVICPVDSAWELKKALPSSEFKIAQSSGHSASEKEVMEELMALTDSFKV